MSTATATTHKATSSTVGTIDDDTELIRRGIVRVELEETLGVPFDALAAELSRPTPQSLFGGDPLGGWVCG